MTRRPPRSTRTDTLFPYTTLFRSTRIGYGGFASATYSLSDEFRLTAGGRVSRDRLTPAGQGAAGPFTFRKSQTTLDWKIGAEYDVAPRIMVYGTTKTGYIPFGHSPDAGAPATSEEHTPQTTA